MQTKRTFWLLVRILLATTVYFLIGNFEVVWTIGYSIVAILFLFICAFFVGAFTASQQEENVEHMLNYFSEKKQE